MVQRGHKIKSNNYINLIIGGLSGTISRTIVAPIDRIKILKQTKNYNNSFRDILNKIIKNEGFLKLWKGNLLNCIRIFPYSSIQFAGYDYFKSKYNKSDLNFKQRLICGLYSGIIASSITHPMDVIRHRLLCYDNINTTKQAVLDIIKENGIRNFLKGYMATTISLTPFITLNFAIYDQLKNQFNLKNNWNYILLGSFSGIISQSICYPLDTIRRRMQLSNNEYKSIISTIKNIYKKGNYKYFYKGMTLNIIKMIPNNSIRFLTYEIFKNLITN